MNCFKRFKFRIFGQTEGFGFICYHSITDKSLAPLGCRGQFSMESIFKEIKTKDKAPQTISNQISPLTKKISEDNFLHIPVKHPNDIDDELFYLTSNDSNTQSNQKQLDQENCAEELISVTNTKKKPTSRAASVRITKQKTELTKLISRLDIQSKDCSLQDLSASLQKHCRTCQQDFPKDKTDVMVCMKCKNSVFCDMHCQEIGFPKHEASCKKTQKEKSLCIIQDLDV